MGRQIRSQAGITRVEILVLASILAGVAFIVLITHHWSVDVAARATCESNLKAIGMMLRQFAIDHQGFYPPLTRPNSKFGDPLPQLTDATKKMPEYVPWYYELIRWDTATKYGLDERVFLCPADKNYDPTRTFTDAASKTAYMSDNISYGLNYDVKYADGTPYRVLPDGRFVDAEGHEKTPSGADRYPDYLRPDEIQIKDLRNFIVAADSNSEVAKTLNFAISIPIDESSQRIGTRHKRVDRPGANVLFGDDHVEMWASVTPANATTEDKAKDINQPINRRYWTLPAD